MSARFFVFMTLKDGRKAKRFLGGEGESVTCFNFCAVEREYGFYRKLILANKEEIDCLCENGRYVFQFADFCGLKDGDYWVWEAGAEFGSTKGEHQLVSWQSENERNKFGCFQYILEHFGEAKAMVPLFTDRTWSMIEGLDVFRIKCVLGLIDPLNYRMVELKGPDESVGEKIKLGDDVLWPVVEMLAFAKADNNEWDRYEVPKKLIDEDRFTECLVRTVRARRFKLSLFHFLGLDRQWVGRYNIRAAVGEMYPFLAEDSNFRECIREWCEETESLFDWWVMNNRDFSAFIGFTGSYERLDESQLYEMIGPFIAWMLKRDDFGFLCDNSLLCQLALQATPVLLADFPTVKPSDPAYLEKHPLYEAVTNWTQEQRDSWAMLSNNDVDLSELKRAVELIQGYNSKFTRH